MGSTLSYLQSKEHFIPDIMDKIKKNHGQSKAGIENINLLTFNMFVRPPLINNNGEDYKDERLLEFISQMHNYDIVCLQEMFASYSRRRENLYDQAKKLGFNYSADSPRPATFALTPHLIDGGLSIVSRYPIVKSEFRPFPLGMGVDAIVQKGILYAQIEIGDSRLHVYNTHTQANYNGDSKCADKRGEQFKAFRKFVEDTLVKYEYRQDDLVVMVGDFNVNARSGLLRHAKELELPQSIILCHMASPPGEYNNILGYLSDNHRDEIEDIIKKDLGEHPLTFGDYSVDEEDRIIPKETVLTGKHSWANNECLDYVLKFTPKGIVSDNPKIKDAGSRSGDQLTIIDKSTSIERFLVEGYPFTQLSDHYGVKVTLEYKPCKTLEKVKNKIISLGNVEPED